MELKVTRPYFDAAPDWPDEAIAQEVSPHPVFRLEPVPQAAQHVVGEAGGDGSEPPQSRSSKSPTSEQVGGPRSTNAGAALQTRW
jgi:hypothetical protein